MAKNLYVRVKPKGPVTEFHRCGIKFGLKWVPLTDLDDATAERLENEQMLETSVEKPEGFDDQVNDEETAAAESDPAVLYGSNVLPAVIILAGGFETTLGELVQQAHKESGLTGADWNGLPEPARELILGGKLHALYVEYKEAKGLQGGVQVVADLKEQLAALTTERDGLAGKVTALTADLAAAGIKLAQPTKPAEATPAATETTGAKTTKKAR